MTGYQVARIAIIAGTAVVNYLLIQTEAPLDPIVKVALGAINVALAAINGTYTLGKALEAKSS